MSLALVHSRAQVGVQAPAVSVETHLTNGLPHLTLVGLPETTVKESKDRVRSAIVNSGLKYPQRRITQNLAPADLPKDGGRYDLAIALGILAADGQVPIATLADMECLGELALSGKLRPVQGVLPAALAAREAGRALVVPRENAEEASLAGGLVVYAVGHLLELVAHLNGQVPLPPYAANGLILQQRPYPDLSEVQGQLAAKRALLLAAAGAHNLLFTGPPGTGKTLLASRLPGLLPPLDEHEALEVAAIQSVSGKAPLNSWPQRPFRHPHHSASGPALVGGGSRPQPGEITLAHHGVLFLDELPEFERRVLEVLREPLETGGCYSHTLSNVKCHRKTGMPTAYAYIRYSSKAQGEAGRDSVDRQMASIQAITKQQGIDLPPENIYSDTGISAHDGSNKRKGKLKELIDMISDMHIKEGDYIFVESIDRLSRQRLLQAKELVNGILEKGVILITTIDGQRYEKPNETNRIDDLQQDILLSVIAKRAYEESKTKSVRRKSAWNRAKKLAEEEKVIFNAHNPPYGIRYNKELNCFEIEEEEAQEIRDFFESLKYVGVSLSIKKLNAYSKRKWSSRNIKHLIDTKYVLGAYMAQRRDENKKKVFERYIENYYPQIVSYELFNEAIAAMKHRAQRKNYGNQSVGSLNIFRHSIKCDCCDASMLFEKQTNPKGIVYPYFQCYTRKELKNGCDQPRFRFDLAFGLFLELIYQSTTGEDFDVHPWQNEMPNTEIEHEWITRESGMRYRLPTQEDIDEEERVENFKELLIKLLSNRENQINDNKKIIELNNLLLEQKSYRDNLMKSFAGFTSGVIPKEFLEVVSKTEANINDIEQKLAETQTQINIKKTTINIYSENDIIDLYKTENGRLKINQFFVANDITFKFNFDKATRTLFAKIFQNGFEIDRIAKQFSLHNPLKEFGINNLNEYFN